LGIHGNGDINPDNSRINQNIYPDIYRHTDDNFLTFSVPKHDRDEDIYSYIYGHIF
jgi:hypothetical protein